MDGLTGLLVPTDHGYKEKLRLAGPATQLPPSRYLWVAYQKEPPYLPVAVADSAKELAQMVGTTRGCVQSTWNRYQHGKLRHSRFHRVRV